MSLLKASNRNKPDQPKKKETKDRLEIKESTNKRDSPAREWYKGANDYYTVPVFSTWRQKAPEPRPEKSGSGRGLQARSRTPPHPTQTAVAKKKKPHETCNRPSDPRHRSGDLPRAPELSTARPPGNDRTDVARASRAPPHHPAARTFPNATAPRPDTCI